MFRQTLTALILLSSLNVMAYTINQNEAETNSLTAMVTTHSFPTVANEAPKDILCISQQWHQQDMMTSNLLKKLVLQAPYAKVFKVEGHNCFDKNKLTQNDYTDLLTILNRIDKVSKSAISVPVEIENPNVEECDVTAVSTDALRTLHSNESDVVIELDNLRNQDASLGKKFLRGTVLIQGAQAMGVGILLMLPTSITKWEGDVLSKAKGQFKKAWTQSPVWDKDEWAINYIGHPLSGALYYNAIRSQGASPLASFVFSTSQSVIWEYGIEAFFERPSIQDLLFTSTIGSALGEAAHRATISMNKNGFNTLEKIVVTVINPSFVFNNGYKKKNLKRN